MEVTREVAQEGLLYGANNKKHICETLRRIYDEVYRMEDGESKETATELLIDAMQMAKKMQNRLSYYQKTYKDNTGNKAENIVYLTGVVSRAKMRQARRNKS